VLPEGLFATPFYLDAKQSQQHVREWLDRILENRKKNAAVGALWGDHDMLAPIEYGLIIVDYLKSTFVSTQGYIDPTRIVCYPQNAKRYNALKSAGLLTSQPPEYGVKCAAVKLPFTHAVCGYEDAANTQLQDWCDANFGLTAAERQAWSVWHRRLDG